MRLQHVITIACSELVLIKSGIVIKDVKFWLKHFRVILNELAFSSGFSRVRFDFERKNEFQTQQMKKYTKLYKQYSIQFNSMFKLIYINISLKV